MAADLITLAEGALLTQFLTPTAKHYGEVALKRIQQLGDRTKALLTSVNREPQTVEEKTLFPLVQAASLEADPLLAEKWAALLANAADPAQRVPVHPSYVEILRQLTPTEAKLLEELFADIYAYVLPMSVTEVSPKREARRKNDALKQLIRLNSIYYRHIEGQFEGVPEPEMQHPFDAMIDNILRQRLLILANAQPPKTTPIVFEYNPDKSKAFFTSLGYDFMLAVTPPTL